MDKATAIQSKYEVTLENTDGNGALQSDAEKLASPTTTNLSFCRTMRGPPESPLHIDSLPLGPLKVHIISGRMSTPRAWKFSWHIVFNKILSST